MPNPICDDLCREALRSDLPPGLVAYMRGVFEGTLVDLDYDYTSIYAQVLTIIKRIRDRYGGPDLADRAERALMIALVGTKAQWEHRQRMRAQLLGVLKWQLTKPPPATAWERLLTNPLKE